MKAFIYSIQLQWKLDFRNKEIMVTYYLVPIIFFLFMGGIFTSIIPNYNTNLIAAMTVFGVTMGGILGSPTPLAEIYGTEIKKSYQIGKVPLWVVLVSNFISDFIHLFLMSLVIFFVAPLLFKATTPPNLLVYFISLILLIIATLASGTVFGLFVKNTSKLTMLTQFAFLPSIMLSGVMFPVEMLPSFLQTIGKLLPATWCFQSMLGFQLELKFLIPVLIIIFLLGTLSFWKLKQIERE